MNMESFTTKNHYREQAKMACKQLTESEKNHAHQQIYQQLFALPEFIKAKTILAYVGYQHEFDTYELLTSCLKLEKQLLLPKVNRHDSTLQLYHISNLANDLVPGYANVLEPKEEAAVFQKNEPIDVIITPAVAFDRKGQRLGRGMGFYDRFLMAHQKSIVIGLAYEEQVFDQIPAEKHDQPIDILLTPTRLFRFDHLKNR